MRFLAALPLLIPLLVPGAVDPVQGQDVEPTASRTDLVDALEVLHAWDARRELAWAAVDATALRSLYVRGSGAGRADLRLLRAYATRGLVVRRMVTQVFAARVLHREQSQMRLQVFDRVAGGELVEDGHVLALPSSLPVSRDIELRLGRDGWLVAAVSGSDPAPRTARR